MATIGATLLANAELRRILQHPAIPFADKERVLRRVHAARDRGRSVLNLVLLMVRRGRPGAIDR